jgi:hypothetical protein
VRHNPSTVVVLAGHPSPGLLHLISRFMNVSVVRPEADAEDAASVLRRAAGISSPYVLVAADPLAGVAAAWQSMWEISDAPRGGEQFELQAGQVLASWRARQFELPDYYLAAAAIRAGEVPPDFYLGPLRGARPRRVAVAGVSGAPGDVGRVLDELRSLEHGPWWPPLEDVVGAARNFFAGGLAEAQPVP